ncbi:DUF3024 domain-containing protein [Derxia lacustris]|uniref:DUF3024 domain-containing protein n=1 Tax=Derxia lacustris TaxID=764842 RepID=UPI000A1719F8|nr:hypothetical protein [Derxia lacustris]
MTHSGPRASSLDRKRIERAIKDRVRYKYVHPEVLPAEPGWRIVSPCCSRNVDPDGGVIDIAWIEPLKAGGWRLHSRDHAKQAWVAQQDSLRIDALLEAIKLDPQRVFWP